MRRLEIADADLIRISVRQEILRSDESRYDHRLHGILLALAGYSCYEVAELLGQSPRTVEYWIKKFEKSGFAGLQEAPRPGRPSLLDSMLREALGLDLRRSPREFGYQQSLWDGKLLSHHLAKRYEVMLGTRQCQRLFHELGFRRRRPRPVIANADEEEMEAYRKTPRPRPG